MVGGEVNYLYELFMPIIHIEGMNKWANKWRRLTNETHCLFTFVSVWRNINNHHFLTQFKRYLLIFCEKFRL